MKNSYLINKGYYIKNDLQSFLIYFDHFSQGITLPKYLCHPYIKKVSHYILRVLIILMYISKIYKAKYKVVSRKDNAIILINGKGKWSNKLRLVRINGQLKIIKKVFNKDIYLKEKKFYDAYKDNKSSIMLPKHIFKKDNIIEMEFLPLKSFQRLILDGTYDLEKSLMTFAIIKNQLKRFYGDHQTLVHGDLWPGNIFIDGEKYYLIDFSDSHSNSPHYDLYTLLYSILSTYHHIHINDKTIANYSLHDTSVAKLLETDHKDLEQVEKQFINYRESRFPGVYYS